MVDDLAKSFETRTVFCGFQKLRYDPVAILASSIHFNNNALFCPSRYDGGTDRQE
ncbi:MAG: hypothetical protein QNL33_13835 [Akkermansiaceae bacterium]